MPFPLMWIKSEVEARRGKTWVETLPSRHDALGSDIFLKEQGLKIDNEG